MGPRRAANRAGSTLDISRCGPLSASFRRGRSTAKAADTRARRNVLDGPLQRPMSRPPARRAGLPKPFLWRIYNDNTRWFNPRAGKRGGAEAPWRPLPTRGKQRYSGGVVPRRERRLRASTKRARIAPPVHRVPGRALFPCGLIDVINWLPMSGPPPRSCRAAALRVENIRHSSHARFPAR